MTGTQFMGKTARMCPATAPIDDYLLDGDANGPEDRVAANHLAYAAPAYRNLVAANQAFVQRAAKVMLAAGIDQFLDLGAGIHGIWNVADVIRSDAPHARLLLVETEPVSWAHLKFAWKHDPLVEVAAIDLYDSSEVLTAASTLFDAHLPVGLIAGSVLHYEPSTRRIATAFSEYHDDVGPGSMLAVSHLADAPAEDVRTIQIAHAELGIDITPRTAEQLATVLTPWTDITSTPWAGRFGPLGRHGLIHTTLTERSPSQRDGTQSLLE
jgi:S-adenosyl methyltransferase